MRILLVSLFVLASSYLCSGQAKYYNEYLEEVVGISSTNDLIRNFKQELHLDMYEVNASSVVEVYIKSSKQFIGVMVDKSKVFFGDLKFIKNNEVLSSYLDKYEPEVAVAIYQKEISKGMSTNQISTFLGDPVESEMIFDKGDELTVYTYANGSKVLFRAGKVDNFIVPRS